jgi:hypothetical protein
VPNGSLTLTNHSGQTVQLSSIIVSVGDVGLISQMNMIGSTSSPAGGTAPTMSVRMQPNAPGTAAFVFPTPLTISASGAGTFNFSSVISKTPGASKSSTQAVTQVNATASGNPVSAGVLPAGLGTASTP